MIARPPSNLQPPFHFLLLDNGKRRRRSANLIRKHRRWWPGLNSNASKRQTPPSKLDAQNIGISSPILNCWPLGSSPRPNVALETLTSFVNPIFYFFPPHSNHHPRRSQPEHPLLRHSNSGAILCRDTPSRVINFGNQRHKTTSAVKLQVHGILRVVVHVWASKLTAFASIFQPPGLYSGTPPESPYYLHINSDSEVARRHFVSPRKH